MNQRMMTLVTQETEQSRIQSIERDIHSMLAHARVMVTVETYSPKGTDAQNRLAHQLWHQIAVWWNQNHEAGKQTSAAMVKTGMKTKYGKILTEYDPALGLRTARIASWSEYTKQERADLINATYAFMAEHRIPAPLYEGEGE